ncbi:MAG: hypothetical protein HUU20_06410 [Pirellulales bacterium]|nr:hypothetical protein [Pirellulales bacterium]
MASSSSHKCGRYGFLGSLLRGVFSADGPGRAYARKKRGGPRSRQLAFEHCEPRQLLAVTAAWDEASGTLNLTGEDVDDSVAVIGQSTYVDIYVGGHFQARITNANSDTVNEINFSGGLGNDSLSVQNIQPSGSLTIGGTAAEFTGVERLAVLNSRDVTINTTGGFGFGTSTITGDLTVNAAGDLTQTGALVVGGTTTLILTTGDVILTNPKNDFSTIDVAADNAGQDVSLVDMNSLVLAASEVKGNLSVQASISSTSRGSLIQTGVLDVEGNTTLAVGRASTIDLSTQPNLLGNGVGTDTVSITSAGTVMLRNDAAAGTKFAATVVTGNLTLDSAGAVTQVAGGVMVVGRTASFNSPGADITLANATNNFGSIAITSGKDVTLRDINGIVFNASTVTEDLVVTAGGQISQRGALTVAGDTTLNATAANNIVLSMAANDFDSDDSGDELIVTGRNVTIRNSDAIDFGTSTVAGTLYVIAGGAITQESGTSLDVTGNATFNATVAVAGDPSITLDEAGNKFSQVAVTTNGDVTLRDSASGLALGSVRITGPTSTLAVTSAGSISQTAPAVVGGTTTLDSGGNDITLTKATNNFSTVVVTSGNDVALADINALELGAVTVTGNLSVTTRGGLTQSGVVDVDGNTTLTAGAASTIDLSTQSNLLGNGPTDTVSILSAGTVLLKNIAVAGTKFDTTKVTGNLTVDSTGPISQVAGGGAMAVGRTATFTTAAPGANITLDNAANNFFVASFEGADVTLSDMNSVALGASLVSGALTVTAGNAISQTGPLDVGGVAILTAGPTSTGSVVLNNSTNDFKDSVSVTAGGSVVLADIDAIELGASTIEGALSVTAVGITNSGNLAVAGTTTLAADAADITLIGANDFVGSVSVTSADNVTLDDIDGLVLGYCSITTNLTVTAGGDLTQSDSVLVGGDADLDVTGFNIDLTLDGNDFNTLRVAGADVALKDVNGVVLGGAVDSSITGDFSLTTNGDITDGGVVMVEGNATLSAGAGNNIDLGLSSHDFSKVSVESGYNVVLNDTGALGLILGTSSISGGLTVVAEGPISQEGPLDVNLTLDLTTTAGAITLDDPDNTYRAVAVNGPDDVTLYNNGDIVLGAPGGVTDIAVTSGGSGYTAATTTVTITPAPGDTTGSGATATASVVSGAVTGIIITNPGSGYSAAPIVTINSTGGGAGATAAASVVTMTVGGNLVVDVVGQIADGNTIRVLGATTLTARTASGGYNDIVLANLASEYGTSLSLTGHDITVANSNVSAMPTFTIGSATATGDLAITLSGAGQVLTNNPGSNMSIEGKTTLKSLGASGEIDLYTAGCQFRDWVFADWVAGDESDLDLEADFITVHP